MSGTHAHSKAFVANSTIPASPPPAREAAKVKWLRQNLFSGPVNTALTVACVALVVLAMPPILEWAVFQSVWEAGSLQECRRIIAATHGEGERGACWAVINERFWQFVFGFYPGPLRWRPVLAFVLLSVALAPVLFEVGRLRRPLLAFTAIYPIIAYYLIWGGSLWPIISFAIYAFILSHAVRHARDAAIARYGDDPALGSLAPVGAAVAAVAVTTLIWWWVISPLTFGQLPGMVYLGPRPVESDAMGGFLLTLIIGVTSIALSLPLGIALALGRQSDLIFIRGLSIIFIEFIRGVPLITLLFVANVVLAYFFPPEATIDKLLRVIIMVTAFASAYMAEVIRGGLASLPRGQYEAADAMGLTYWQSMRLVIMPQALKVSIPGVVNTFIGLFKDTTLVSVIALFDPLGIIAPIRADSNWNGIIWELYGFVALFFFICCFAMSRYSQYLERKLATGHR